MSEQRGLQHALWELHQAELEHDRMLARIDLLLDRNAHLQLEVRALRLVTEQPPEARPEGATRKADQGV